MEVREVKKQISIVDVLNYYLGVNLPMRGTKSRNIPCPIHKGKDDNFAVDLEKNIATCFSQCNETWNVINLTMRIHNVNFKTAMSLLERDFVRKDVNMSKTQRKASVGVGAPTNALRKFNNLYKTLSQDDYFLNRGISQEVIDRYQLGAVTDQTDLTGFSEREKIFLRQYNRFIIPISDRFFISRLDESKAEGDKYRNFGEAELLNGEYIGDTSRTFIFVTEGAIDAFTIESLGHHAIALNSASNSSLLVKGIQLDEEKARQQQFILLADNDAAGKKLKEKLQADFKKMNMSLFSPELDSSVKDINELLLQDQEKAVKALDAAIDDCINEKSAFNMLDYFFEMKKIEPIQIKVFPKLNNILGGIRPGLTVVGAGSSLGKTTFIQAIADDVASQGNHVLFFSLEMGSVELIAKSLVRTMGELKKTKKIKGEITFTRDLLNGDIKNHDILMAAVGAYERTAKNLFIHEGMFDINVYTIRQEIDKHINLHKKKPLVIVDYIQVLEPLNDRLSDKQATDKNITELKRITRDLDVPLIAISSFNRDGYNKQASFTSFKESGSIEYSSDVVIALELHIIKDLDTTSEGKVKDLSALDKAKSAPTREINLRILKNRFGKAFEELTFHYHTATNKFEEHVIEISKMENFTLDDLVPIKKRRL